MSYNSFRNKSLNFRKNKLALVLSSALSLVFITVLAVVFFTMGRHNAKPVMGSGEDNVEKYIDVSDLEMRGMWIATTLNIDYPSKTGLSKKELKAEIDDILQRADFLGINSVFFQVRPACDALYDSKLFPSSRYVSGVQGRDCGFDSLEYILKEAKKYNIDIHAWVNPYRVTMNESELFTLSENHIVRQHPEYAITYADGKTYLDPATPEVRDYIVSGVREIVENYPDVAGIHFDDYFYPYPSGNAEFDDEASYLLYGGGADKADWRRENVNTLVREVYTVIKEINPECDFGVSVFGIWANKGTLTPVEGSNTSGLEAYHSLYCDALAWVKGRYVDYIAPQVYWSFDTKAAPFDDVARWWNANLDGTGVDLYIGHAAYKSGDYDEGEIYKQIEMARTLSSYRGSIFYGYENICENTGKVADDIGRALKDIAFRQKVNSNGGAIKISFPDNNSYINSANSYVLGSCDPAYPLYVNGTAVSKTIGGYFGLYLGLDSGRNEYTFVQNGKTYELVINRGTQKVAYNDAKKLQAMEISNVYPEGSVWLLNDEKLPVSCTAPAGSVVTARVGETMVVLSPTVNPEGEGKYLYERYEGSINPSELVKSTGIRVLGNIEFTAELGNETATIFGGEISRIGSEAYAYAEVKNDYTHTKVGTSTSFYDDFLPSSKGMRDYVTDIENGYCKMRFGGYIKEENLEFTYGKPLMLNTILTAAVEVNAKDTTNNKNNSTDIRFGVTENIPVDVDFNGENGDMRIIIYNTDTSIIPQFVVPENPLIANIVGKKGTRENMLMYHVTLKEKTNFYGFKIVYENGCMIVKLNNPQTLADGDKPLLGKRIVVDAGHGGIDGGAPGPGNIPEKILNRNIATYLKQQLVLLGAEVVDSRPEDETVDLYARMDLLTAECPDMAVSIHHNSVAASANALKTRGFVALYSNNSGVSLSDTIADVVCRELGRDKKPTAYQQLAVARNHMFPSTLLEMCFISNVEEYQWSITEGNDKRSAEAIAEGILEYYRNQEKYLDY